MNWLLRRFLMIGIGGLAVVLAVALTIGSPLEARRSDDPPVLDKFVYLPMVSSPPTIIAGKVMNGGSPEVNGLVALMDQGAPGTPAYQLDYVHTDSEGNYQFSDVPLLRPGYSYFVRFIYQGGNTLWTWQTAPIFELKKGDYVTMPTFDVAPVVLTDPAPDGAVTLPHTFRWTPRPGNPNETYRFYLSETTGNTFFSPDLGHNGEYTLRAEDVPTSLDPAPTFTWTVLIYTADGSRGEMHGRKVSFTNLAQ